jgi:hypothetical protein
LIPFYLFTALVGKANFQQAPGTTGRWRTFFATDDATTKVLNAIWLTAIADGALHLFSFFLSVYLLVIFKKITHLPPDMNPLEDNLTSRRKSKHKYKNSSVIEIGGKRFNEVTTSTMNASGANKMSRVEEPLIGQPGSGRMSFLQSRTNKDGSFSPHNPDSARMSRTSLADQMYQQPHSVHGSRADARSLENYASSRITSQMPSNPTMSKRSSVVMSIPINQDEDSDPGPEDEGQNWRVLDKYTENEYDPYRTSSVRSEKEAGLKGGRGYEPLAQSTNNFVQQPLGMNPPTPPLRSAHVPNMDSPLSQLSRKYKENGKENDRTHTMVSDVSVLSMSSRYSNDETVISAAPTTTTSASGDGSKSRFYGDLAAAMRGVRQHGVTSPRPKSMVGSVHNAGSDISSLRPSPQRSSRTSPNTARTQRPRSQIDSVSGTVIRRPTDEKRQRGSPRVVGHSGADYVSAEGDLGLGRGRREVSGKVAEEGRGGFRSGLFMRKVSGMS